MGWRHEHDLRWACDDARGDLGVHGAGIEPAVRGERADGPSARALAAAARLRRIRARMQRAGVDHARTLALAYSPAPPPGATCPELAGHDRLAAGEYGLATQIARSRGTGPAAREAARWVRAVVRACVDQLRAAQRAYDAAGDGE